MQHERTPHERCLLRWHRRDCSPCHDFRRQSNCLKVSSRNLSIGSSVSADSVDRAAAANPPASFKRQELVQSREEPTDLPQHWTTCWISKRRWPLTTQMSQRAVSLRTPRLKRFWQKPRTPRASTSSALMELNLAVPRLQGGVLRSATTSPQTSQRVQGPTCRLSSTGISPIC